MTFDEIVANVAEAVGHATSATAAYTRIGKFVNKRYKRVTGNIGLIVSRRAVQTVAFTIGLRNITIPTCQKVISIQDLTTATPKPLFLEEISYEEMLEETPRTDRPTLYAIESVTSHAVVVRTNFTPQDAFSVSVEYEAQAGTLSGAQEPAFSEDFHDILEFGAKADELRKMEKVMLARDAEQDFERRLGELRLHIAVSAHQDIVQGKKNARVSSQTSGGGGGSSAAGGASYEQTGLITFMRAPLTPFGVEAGSAKVDNLDADLLDGLDSTAFALTTDPPAAHATTHQAGGSDPIKLDNLAAPDDNTDLDVTSTTHGLAPKSPADATKFLNGAATPAFALVKDSDLSTSDITTNDVSTSKHGFASKRMAVGVVTLTDGATPALDASLGNVFVLVAAGNRTIAVPSNAVAGQKIVIRHNASGGARTLSLNTGAGGFRFGTDITALTATTSGKTDYIGCIYNATDSKWDVVAYVKGF